MSDSTTILDLISASQSQKETTANALFDAASPAMLYGRRALTTAGLTWGYYGGCIIASGAVVTVANGTVTLTASATNYVEANATTGAVTVNTSSFTGGKVPLYEIVTGASSVTSYSDKRTTLAGSAALADGDKGDVVVSGSGATWTIDSGVLSAFGRTLIDDADAAAARTTLGLGSAATLAADTDTTLSADSDLRTPTQKAVKAYIDSIATSGASDVMIFKGIIDCSGNPNYPAADAGHLYKVSVAGKIGGASGPNVEAGDTLYCITDGTAAGNHATVGANWNITQVNIDGAVIGPTSATDNALALYDGTGGKIIKDSAVTLSTDGTFAANSDGLVPTQKAVKTYVASAVGGGGGTPGGSTTQIQFNDGGAFGGDADLTWDKTNNILIVGSTATPGIIKGGANSGTGAGATLTIKGGTGSSAGTTAGVGGNTVISSGDPGNSSAVPGDILIQPADASSAGGGNVSIKGGTTATNGAAGAVTISGGTGGANGAGAGGAVTLQGGAASATNGNASGAVTIKTQTPPNSGGVAGNIAITVGDASAAGFGNGPAAASFTLTGGKGGNPTSSFAGAVGGVVQFTAGAGGNGNGAGAPGAGGDVKLTGGAAGTSGTGNANGGNVTLTGGASSGTGARGNVVLNGSGAALATSATGGFTCLPTCAGTPTGTPASVPTGCVAAVIDTTNSKLYLYIGGAWKSVTLA